MQEEKHNVEDEEQEIDLLELAGKIWDARKTILKWGVVGAVVGIVIAFSIPKEYTTTIKLALRLLMARKPAVCRVSRQWRV